MPIMEEYIRYYVDKMRKGKGDASLPLMEMDNEAIPLLIEAYYRERNKAIRISLIEAVWQHRSVNTLDFLAEVLQDDTPEIWQQGLDGIVATARQEGLEVLKAEKARLLALPKVPKGRIEWIDEAFDQLTEFLADQENPGDEL